MALSSLEVFLRARQREMTEALEALVVRESPTLDKGRVDALGKFLQQWFAHLGAKVSVAPDSGYGDHLSFVFPGDATVPDERAALIVGHFDTVWPADTLSARPFQLRDGKAWGPGTFDMKAGIVMIAFALQAIRQTDMPLPRRVVVFLASDEELGSPSSRRILAQHCQRAAYALVLEPPLPDGAVKTARKGVARFTLEVEGRAAHAGIEPEKGVSAVKELAHQVLHLEALNDFGRGTTVNVGLIRGGQGPNVIPAHAEAEINIRAWNTAEMERIRGIARSLQAVTPGARVVVREGVYRPPMDTTAASRELFARARKIASDIGMELRQASSGGASDGNLCTSLGVPTLDGLGALGDGAHADHEHVVLDSLPERAILLAALLTRL